MTALHQAPKRKAAGGYHTTTTAITKHTRNIAPGTDKSHTGSKACATLHPTPATLGPVLENTMESAGNLPDSEVFSRPESFGFGRDGSVRKAGRMADSMFSTSRPPVALEKAASGLQSQSGAETMTDNVISLARARAAKTVQTHALANPLPCSDAIQRQAAIENALSVALFHMRDDSVGSLHAAIAKTNRALSLLKQACESEKSILQEG